MKTPLWHGHPTVRTGDELTLGERAADVAVKSMGSWMFLGAQTLFIAVWMTANVVVIVRHWDPYPWILLNLIFSVQAAYAAPLVLLSQRRGDQRNSERAQRDLETDCESLQLVKEIHARITKEPNV